MSRANATGLLERKAPAPKIPDAPVPDPPVLVTIDELRNEICPRFFGYVPPARTLHRWLYTANLRKIKVNCRARTGGGTVHFNREAVMVWLSRLTKA